MKIQLWEEWKKGGSVVTAWNVLYSDTETYSTGALPRVIVEHVLRGVAVVNIPVQYQNPVKHHPEKKS